jgi:hypothetical protein
MVIDSQHNSNNLEPRYKVWFFAGAETRDAKFNVFTGSFIRLMKRILEDEFEFIRGTNHFFSAMNVIWALNNAQKPIEKRGGNSRSEAAFNQIVASDLSPDTQLVIVASSSGSIVAAQTACYMAERNRNNVYFSKPFHLVLGASMLSGKSELFKKILHYQKEGIIGTILHDEVQDEGDSAAGVGGLTRTEAYRNAFGLMFPFLSKRFKRPSFLNTHPEKGHLHRKRSKTVQKALDYIEIILIKHKLAGDGYAEIAKSVIEEEVVRINRLQKELK